jgi:hypothetical protein
MTSSLSPKQILALSAHIASVKNLVKLNIDLQFIQETTKEVFEEEQQSLSSFKRNIIEKDKSSDDDKDVNQKTEYHQHFEQKRNSKEKDVIVHENEKEYPNFISPPSHFIESKDYSSYWTRFNKSSNDMLIFKLIHEDTNITTMEKAFEKHVIYFNLFSLIERNH